MTDWNIVGIEMRIQTLEHENEELRRSVRELREQLDEVQNRVADHEHYLSMGGIITKVEASF